MIFKKLRDSVKIIVIILVIAFVATTIWQYGFGGAMGSGDVSIVAKVGGKRISQEDFYRAFNMEMERQVYYFGGVRSDQIEIVKANALNWLIDNYLVSIAIEKEKIQVSKDEVAGELETFKKQFLSEDDYQEWLEKTGYKESFIMEVLGEELKAQKLIKDVTGDVTVTQNEIEELFDEVKEEGATLDEATRTDMENRLLELKKAEKFQNWLRDYRAKTNVTIIEPQMAAYNYMLDKDYSKAIKKYKEAVKLYGDDPYLYTSMARVYMEMGDKDKSISTYKQAISFNEEDPYLYLLLGNAYMRLDKKDEALEAYKKSSDLSTGESIDDLMIHSDLMHIFTSMDELEEASNEEVIIERIVKILMPVQTEDTEDLDE